MNGKLALDTSVAIRFLNGDQIAVDKVIQLPEIILPTVVVGELLFGAKNSRKSLQNLSQYFEFIKACTTFPLASSTPEIYADVRFALKKKGRPIPMNDIWIAAQCIENGWILVTDDSDFSYIDGLDLERW